MSLFAIGDLHLALGNPDKSMELFGSRWQDYHNKIISGFSGITNDDTVVLCGDISWGMDFESSLEDFRFIDSLPGKKLVLKGNHDYWWNTVTKTKRFFEDNGISSIDILFNNSFLYNDMAICGTRGWFYEEETGGEHDKKIMLREIQRLERSLICGGEHEKLVFLHYPPKYINYECPEILELLQIHGVKLCCYGHIHGKGIKYAFNSHVGDTFFKLVSADALDFTPYKIL